MRRQMPGRAAAVVLAAVVAGMLAGCGTGGAPTSSESPGSGNGPGPEALATYPAAEAGMDALLEGRLIISDRCVWVRGEGMRSVPVFPEGDAELAGGVLTWRGDDYVDGDTIALGGGYLPSGGTIPAGCGLEPEGLFFVSPY